MRGVAMRVALLVAPFLALSGAEICDTDAGWKTYVGTVEPKEHCYQYLDMNPSSADSGEKTWDEAQSHCEGIGGDLAAIRNSEENGNVMGMCATFRCWIGLNDKASESNWNGGNGYNSLNRRKWDNFNNAISFYDSCTSGSECSGGRWNYQAWSNNEPNNYKNKEDCAEMWNHGSGVGTWNDMPCYSSRNEFVCEMPPGCPQGYYQWSTTTVTIRGKAPACQQCPQGKYKSKTTKYLTSNYGGIADNQCILCQAGHYASTGGLIASSCSGECSKGYYCDAGSTSKTQNKCPKGKYGATTGLKSSECSGPCSPGYYCLAGETTSTPSTQRCAAGRYGAFGDSDSQCAGACWKGYYCGAGTAQSDMKVCGHAGVYCPLGSQTPRTVTGALASEKGYYSTPTSDPENQRSSQSIAEPGYYAGSGVRHSCPAGVYGASEGLKTADCDGPCTPGSYCPEGSTSSTQTPCGWDDSCEGGCPTNYHPENYYCQVNKETNRGERLSVPSGHYSVPVPDDEATTLPLCKAGGKSKCPKRTGIAVCPSDSICENGVKKPRLEWTTCFAIGDPGYFPEENSAGAAVATVTAVSNTGAPSVSYALADTIDFYTTIAAYFTFDSTATSAVGSKGTEASSGVSFRTNPVRSGSHSGQFATDDSLLRFDVPDAFSGDGTLTDFTIAFWMNPSKGSFEGSFKTLFSTGSNKLKIQHKGFVGAEVSGLGTLRFQIGGTVLDVALDDTTATVPMGEWAHVAAVKDASTDEMKIYVTDATKQQPVLAGFLAGVESGFVSDAQLTIGTGFNGYIDDFALFSKALFTSELAVVISGVTVPQAGCTTIDAASFFTISGNQAKVAAGKSLDKETCEYYALTIKATATAGGKTDVGYCTIPIQVKDMNDAPSYTTPFPSAAETSPTLQWWNFEVPEKSLVNTPTTDSERQAAWRASETKYADTLNGACTADDPDVGQERRFILDSSQSEGCTADDLSTCVFRVSSCSGVVLVNKQTLDVNNCMGRDPCWYRIWVKVIDDHASPLEASPLGQAVVMVKNINDPPEFKATDPKFVIEENLALAACTDDSSPYVSPFDVSSIVYDPDGDVLSWAITRNDDEAFVIDAATGRVCQSSALAAPLNFELKGSYSIELKATDPEGLSDKKSYSITILDVNDAPTISAPALEVPENSDAGFEVGVVTALDEDAMGGLQGCTMAGGKCANAVSFSIISGSCPEGEAGCFWAGDDTFEIVDNADCDTVEKKVRCTATLKVKTADSPDLNFEQHEKISLTIRATDLAMRPLTKTYTALFTDYRLDLTITNVNEAPVITAGQEFTVFENASLSAPVSGGKVRHTDPDNAKASVQSHYYSLAAGADAQKFRIDSDGTLRVNELVDFETKDTYSISLTVKDTGNPNLEDTATVTVRVLNVNEPPIIPHFSFSVDENEQDVSIGQIFAYDVDAGDNSTLAFALTDEKCNVSAPGVLAETNFEISSTGMLRAKAGAGLNYEAENSHTKFVCVTDRGGLTTTVPFTIGLNNVNEKPFLNDTVISCVKDAAIGTKVNPRLSGTDPDTGTDQPWTLTYTIVSGNEANEFALDSATGQITAAVGDLSPKTVTLIMTVTDGVLTSDTATITIKVQDSNAAPELSKTSYFLSIPELVDTLPYTLTKIEDITATDEDIVNHQPERVLQKLICSLSMDDPSKFNPFQIAAVADANGASCQISIIAENAEQLDFEDPEKNHFAMTVEICDDYEIKLCDSAPLVVNVTDVNEQPTISNSVDKRDISELAAIGAEIIPAIAANDQDASDKGNLHYSWTNTDPTQPSPFILNPSTGKVTVSSSLDYERDRAYTFALVIKDNHSPPHEATANILISVLNQNEPPVANASTLCGGKPFFEWTEGVSGPATIGALNVADPDRVDDKGNYLPTELAGLTFEIVSGNDDNFFTIDKEFVNLNGTLDYEAKPVHTLEIMAVDSGEPGGTPLNSTFVVEIRVKDVNDLSVTACEKPSGEPCELKTRGGDEFVLVGGNFGFEKAEDEEKHGAKSLNVTFGPTGSEYRATNCTIETRNTRIKCTAGPGVGGPLKWTVTYGEWTKTFDALAGAAYAKPYISSITGAHGMPTEGGVAFVVRGENFGPTDASVHSTVRVAGVEYKAAGCKVTAAHVAMSCSAPPGVGKDLGFKVVAGGQASNTSFVNGSYLAPAITDIRVKNATSGLWIAPAEGLLETRGGEEILLTGTNFGPVNYTGVEYSAMYGTAGDKYTAAKCALSSAHSAIICKSAPGVGYKHLWVLTVQKQASGASSIMTSYKPPIITKIYGQGATMADTTGGQQIIIEGHNFPPDGIGETAIGHYGPTLTVGGVTTLQAGAIEAVCTVAIAYTQLSCLTGEGSGTGHSWDLTVDGQTSALFDANTGYAPPVIQSLLDEKGRLILEAKTSGNEPVIIQGRNFGPQRRPRLDSVTYGPCTEQDESGICHKRRYFAYNCTIITSHTKIQCMSVVGGGASLKWIMYVDGQQSTAPTTSYARPTIASLTGPGATASSTHGYDIVTITGDNFADQAHFKEDAVTYGPTGTEYTAQNCRLVVNHTQIECYTVAGEGTGHAWLVTVEKQSNTLSYDITTSYAPPSDLEITPAFGPTAGGIKLYLSGLNFGRQFDKPSAKAAQVFFSDEIDKDVPMEYEKFVLGAEKGPFVAPTGRLAALTAARGRDQLVLTQPVGHGYRDIEVRVDKQKTAATARFNYDAPNISNVVIQQPESGYGTYLDMIIVGSNFGLLADGKLYIGETEAQLTGSTYEDYRVKVGKDDDDTSAVSYISSWSHSQIMVKFVPFTELVPQGFVAVHLGEGLMRKTSEPTKFKNFNPVILSLNKLNDQSCAESSLCQYYAYCAPYESAACADKLLAHPVESGADTAYRNALANTEGGGLLKLWGKFFGDDPQITVAGASCPKRQLQYGNKSFIEYETTEKFGQLSVVVCTLPAGQGALQDIIVTSGDQDSQARGLNFALPKVSWKGVTKMSSPTTGGGLVTLTGTNFGTTGATMIVGSGMVVGSTVQYASLDDPSQNVISLVHSKPTYNSTMVFKIPEGVGRHNFSLVVGRQYDPTNSIPFTYDIPTISNFNSEEFDKYVYISIDGTNFGTPALGGDYSAHFSFPEDCAAEKKMAAGTCWEESELVCTIVSDRKKENSTEIISHTHTHIEMKCPTESVDDVPTATATACEAHMEGQPDAEEAKKRCLKKFVIRVEGRVGTFTAPVIHNYTIPADVNMEKEVAQNAASTTGGTIVELTGLYFTDSPEITIGGKKCPIVAGSPRHTETSSTLRCVAPPGEGKGKPLVIKSYFGRSTSDVAVGFPFDYLAPNVFSVEPAGGCATDGTTVITIAGEDFGDGSTAQSQVYLDGNQCKDVLFWNHTLIRCVAPEGQGRHVPLAIMQGFDSYSPAQVSARGDYRKYSYIPPAITGIEGFDEVPTEGALVTITGTNLGTHGVVFVTPRETPKTGFAVAVSAASPSSGHAAATHNHTRVVAMVPADPGYGGGRDFHLNVSGQAATHAQTFRYVAPAILSVTGDRSCPDPSSCGIPTIGLKGSKSDIDAAVRDPTKRRAWVITVTGSSFGTPVEIMTGDGNTTTQHTAEVRIFSIGAPIVPADRNCESRDCQICEILTQTHTEITCMPPEGMGSSLPMHVAMRPPNSLDRTTGTWPTSSSVGGFPLTLQNEEGYGINYSKPIIYSWMPSPVDANGGTELTITGNNFGETPTTARVSIAGVECADAEWHEPWVDPTKKLLPTRQLKNRALPRPYLTCIAPKVAVGIQNISITVAYQTENIPQDLSTLETVCKAGYYGQESENCAKCPSGGLCATDNLPAPVAKEEFWRFDISSDHQDYETNCPAEMRNRTLCPYITACEPEGACTGLNTCSQAYGGERCAECAEGYFKLSGVCEPCPDCPVCLVLGVILAAIILAACGWVLAKKRINFGVVSIGVDYFQILAVLAMSNQVHWPQSMKRLFQYLSLFSFNLDLLAPECSYPDMEYSTKWALIEMMPLLACSFFISVHFIRVAHKYFIMGRRKALHKNIHLIIGNFLEIFYYMYLYITKSCLDIFNCSPTEPPDGHTYLEVVFEACDKPGGVHRTLLPAACFFFLLYSLGFPTLVGSILYRNAARCRDDQLLRAQHFVAGTSVERIKDDLVAAKCWNFRKRYKNLYYHYKPDFHYWILVRLSRKFAIASAGLLFRRNPVFLLAFSLLIVNCSYALQVRNRPYMSNSDMLSIVKKHENELGTITLNLLKKRSDMKHRSKGIFSSSNKELEAYKAQKKAQQGVMQFFWNYNTVEASLLFCATLVLLGGLMFQDQTAIVPGSVSEEALFWIVMLIIIGSILYFFCVLLSEIGVGLGWKICFFKDAKKKVESQIKNEKEENSGRHATDADIQMTSPAMNPLHKDHQKDEASDETAKQVEEANETIAQMQEELAKLKKQAAIASLGSSTTKDDVLHSHGSSFKKKKKKAGKKKAFGEDGSAPVGRDGRGWSVFGKDKKSDDNWHSSSNPMGHNPMGHNPMQGNVGAGAGGRPTDLMVAPGGKHSSMKMPDEELAM